MLRCSCCGTRFDKTHDCAVASNREPGFGTCPPCVRIHFRMALPVEDRKRAFAEQIELVEPSNHILDGVISIPRVRELFTTNSALFLKKSEAESTSALALFHAALEK